MIRLKEHYEFGDNEHKCALELLDARWVARFFYKILRDGSYIERKEEVDHAVSYRPWAVEEIND